MNCEWCNLTDYDKRYQLINAHFWSAYLSDNQDYIGRVIVVLNRHCGSLSELNADEWLELREIIKRLERSIKKALNADMFNWSCLMNDFYKKENPYPHLHIHLRPRYKNAVYVDKKAFYDDEFAHHYNNHKKSELSEREIDIVYNMIKAELSEM